MATEWRYAKSGQQHGPVSAADLKALAKSGEILPTDMVWKEGMAEWKQAGSLKGLFPPTTTPAPQKAPPLLPTASSVTNAPFTNTSEGEKASPFHAVWKYCMVHPVKCSAVGLGASFLLNVFVAGSLYSIGFDTLAQLFMFPMSIVQFSLFMLLVFFSVKALMLAAKYEYLVGKWMSHDGTGEPFEIVGKSLTRGSVLVGTLAIQKDRRLEISSGGKVIEVWQLVKLLPKELVFQDAAGEVKRYTKTDDEKHRSRLRLLQEKWEPVNGEGPGIQFTDDRGEADEGAYIRFDGFAARYSLSKKPPFDTITIHYGDSQIVLKILSLERDELVLGGEDGSVHYKRGVSISAAEAKRRSDAFNDKMKTVGKTALATVGVVGAGIAILGVAAVAGAAATGSRGGGSGGGPRRPGPLETHCEECQSAVNPGSKRCPYCGSTNIWSM